MPDTLPGYPTPEPPRVLRLPGPAPHDPARHAAYHRADARTAPMGRETPLVQDRRRDDDR